MESIADHGDGAASPPRGRPSRSWGRLCAGPGGGPARPWPAAGAMATVLQAEITLAAPGPARPGSAQANVAQGSSAAW